MTGIALHRHGSSISYGVSTACPYSVTMKRKRRTGKGYRRSHEREAAGRGAVPQARRESRRGAASRAGSGRPGADGNRAAVGGRRPQAGGGGQRDDGLAALRAGRTGRLRRPQRGYGASVAGRAGDAARRGHGRRGRARLGGRGSGHRRPDHDGRRRALPGRTPSSCWSRRRTPGSSGSRRCR